MWCIEHLQLMPAVLLVQYTIAIWLCTVGIAGSAIDALLVVYAIVIIIALVQCVGVCICVTNIRQLVATVHMTRLAQLWTSSGGCDFFRRRWYDRDLACSSRPSEVLVDETFFANACIAYEQVYAICIGGAVVR